MVDGRERIIQRPRCLSLMLPIIAERWGGYTRADGELLRTCTASQSGRFNEKSQATVDAAAGFCTWEESPTPGYRERRNNWPAHCNDFSR